MTRAYRWARVLLLSLAVLGVRAVLACPTCAGSAAPTERSIWPIVGGFMLVPPFLAIGVILAIRRESRSTTFEGPGPRGIARVLLFKRR